MEPIDLIQQKRTLTAGTLKNYRSQLNTMVRLTGDDKWWEKDPTVAIKAINKSGKADTTKRSLFQVALVLMLVLEQKEKSELFREEMNALKKKYDDAHKESPDHVISTQQKENMISYEELRKYIDKVKEDIKDNQELHMVYAILESLIRVPVRNDHAGMIYTNKRDYQHERKPDTNYLVDTVNKKMTFSYYQKEKTTKTRPQEHQDLPKDLEKIWKAYIRRWGIQRGDVIVPLDTNQLTKLLTKTSEAYIGKRVSTTLIRKIVVNHKFSDPEYKKKKAEQAAFAKKMGHSVKTQDEVYNKN